MSQNVTNIWLLNFNFAYIFFRFPAENRCVEKPRSECKTEYQEVCEPTEKCHTNYRKKCIDIPYEVCANEPVSHDDLRSQLITVYVVPGRSAKRGHFFSKQSNFHILNCMKYCVKLAKFCINFINFFEILPFKGRKKQFSKKFLAFFSASPRGFPEPPMPRTESAGYVYGKILKRPFFFKNLRNTKFKFAFWRLKTFEI